jgi:hypothetical protein
MEMETPTMEEGSHPKGECFGNDNKELSRKLGTNTNYKVQLRTLPRERLMCGAWRGYDVSCVRGGESILRLIPHQ